MTPGDRVNWTPTTRSGYGVFHPAAGVVRKIGPKRVQIEVRVREPYGQRRWVPALKWVPPDALTPRILPSAAFSEPMSVCIEGFQIKAWKHPTGVATLFPDGIWYGDIDGHQIGAPCASEEDAVRMAHLMLLNGQYRTALLAGIETYERRLNHPIDEKYRAEAENALPDLRERLAKLDKIRNAPVSEPIAVRILRGSPTRAAETGPGYGRLVPALFLRELDQTGHNVKCRLLADDPGSVGKPDNAGEEGWWCITQIKWEDGN